MLPHGTAELAVLTGQCAVTSLGTTNGWNIDVWDMTTTDVDRAVDVYNAVHAANLTSVDPVVAKLATQGINVLNLLAAPGQGLELVTRADIAEYAAAASVIATDGFTAATMLMPNIPKMARRKSESGVDVFDIKLDTTQTGTALVASEQLGLASVKHTTTSNASPLRLDIQNSVSVKHELSQSYLMAQLRFVAGRLVAEGMAQEQAIRTFLFMDDFPNAAHVGLCGIAVVDPALRSDMVDQLNNLPIVTGGHKFRIVTFPDLAFVHQKCP